MTNGEKLIEAFPSIGLYKKAHDGIQINFNSVWFNAEYKEPTTKNNLDVTKAIEILKADSITGYSVEDVLNARDMAIKALQQEPRKGRWVSRPHIYGVAFCSECGFELRINNTNYCPNCGAKMAESEG